MDKLGKTLQSVVWCDSVWGDESHPGWLDKWQDYGNNDIHSRAFLLLDSSAPCRWHWDKLAWLHAKLLMFPCSHEEKKCTNWTVSKSCKLVEFSWVSLGPFDRWCLWGGPLPRCYTSKVERGPSVISWFATRREIRISDMISNRV